MLMVMHRLRRISLKHTALRILVYPLAVVPMFLLMLSVLPRLPLKRLVLQVRQQQPHLILMLAS